MWEEERDADDGASESCSEEEQGMRAVVRQSGHSLPPGIRHADRVAREEDPDLEGEDAGVAGVGGGGNSLGRSTFINGGVLTLY